MSDLIRVGIIGANPSGSWGAMAHIPALRALNGYDVTAVCTSSQESARNSANYFGIAHAFADPNLLAACEDVDLVVVCVRVPEHDRLVRAAIAAGKHVYCEWPLGIDTAEAMELRGLARQAGVRHVVGLQARMAPALRHMRDLIQQGAIGHVLSASVRHSGGWPIAIPQSMTYLQLAETGANLETIRGGHSLDALCYVAGELVDASASLRIMTPQVTVIPGDSPAPRTAPDQILAVGALESGAVANVHIQGGPSRGTGFTLEVNGSEGDLAILTNPGSSGIQMIEPRLYRIDRTSTTPTEVDMPESYRDDSIDELVPAARNVARMYKAFRDDRAVDVPDFDSAVARHQTLDLLRRASASGQRAHLGGN